MSRRAFLCGRPPQPLYGRTEADPPRAREENAGPCIAQISLQHCLSAAYQVCAVCTERCGTRGAIALRNALPVVDPSRCTGCGECADACPSPLKAIRMRRIGDEETR